MILRGRKLPFFLFTLLVVAVVAAGWAFYHLHQKRYANYTAAPFFLPPGQQTSDVDATRSTTSTSQLQASVFSSRTKPAMHAPTGPDSSTTEIDEGVDEISNDIYDMVREVIRNEFPELNLSPSELLDLSETVVQLRDALANLRNTDRDPENFGTIRQLEDIRDNAIWDFERITSMRLHEFLHRLPTDGGLDNAKLDNAEISLEPLSDYQP